MLNFPCHFQVLARHAGLHARRHATTNTSKSLRRATTTLFLAGTSAAVAAYFFLPDISRGAPTCDNIPLNPSHFTPVKLVSSTVASSGTKILTVTIPPELLPKGSDLFAPIWSVFIKDDDIQVERPYTPLDGVDEEGNMRFWIKRYQHGEVSRWLYSKQVGETIEIRGPLKTWSWKDDAWDEIILISGGTGITPFYQLLRTVFSENSSFQGRITLLHSSRIPSELPPRDVLDPLLKLAQHNPGKFRLKLFVDSFGESNGQSSTDLEIHQGRIGKDSICGALHSASRVPWWRSLFSRDSDVSDRKILFLVCGPQQMVEAIAGPYGRNYSQGPIGGMLRSLGYKSHQVWKL
ncbi:ferredoxin reductase-like C-terminal NADP-linked domain-containing protein [Suillus clintonianus]|uniref:ferredoxin reductase-like C-terminal NADP-linked domain-containing protein n=1 Tax=Suillus clintonianus TaxID=1904413 RepID=UPI001B8620FF|nr:ferredoxin reductase-like C-terminal NADP-linked domain-containing protein [Suillus clintonianus]KAG2152928.1 ferredoxin reductase-like C-terminal NADP-linked domain-containing protein [Suillus clintonianus]